MMHTETHLHEESTNAERVYSRSAMMHARMTMPQSQSTDLGLPVLVAMNICRPAKKPSNPVIISQVNALVGEMQICPRRELPARFYLRFGETFSMSDANYSVLSSFLGRCDLREEDELLRSTQPPNAELQFVQTLIYHALAAVGPNEHLPVPMLDPDTNIWWGGEETVAVSSFTTLWKTKYLEVYRLPEILVHFNMSLAQLFAATPGVHQNETMVWRVNRTPLVSSDILFPPKDFPMHLVHAGRTNLVTVMSDPRFPLTVQPLHAALPSHHPWREVILKVKRMLLQEKSPMKLTFFEQSPEVRTSLKECGPIGLQAMLTFFPSLFAVTPKTDDMECAYVDLHSSVKESKVAYSKGAPRNKDAGNGSKRNGGQYEQREKYYEYQKWRGYGNNSSYNRSCRPQRRNSWEASYTQTCVPWKEKK